MSRSRADRFQLMLAHRAAAAALEASLKDEAAGEYDREKASVTWSWAGKGSVYTSLNQDAAIVTAPEALLAWVQGHYPEQVHTVTEIRPAWLTKVFLPGLDPAPGMGDPDPHDAQPGTSMPAADVTTGALVPGVRFVKGGGLRSVSIKPEGDVTRRLNLAAADYANGTGPMPELTP